MLGFFMSFLLLIMALYGFQLISKDASDLETRAVYTDISGRVATGVLNAVDVGVKRVGSISVAESSDILYQQVLLMPVHVHGQQYRVALSAGEVRVTSEDGRIVETATTFNLQTTGGNCEKTTPVCSVSGTFLSNPNGIKIKYEYKSTGPSPSCNHTPAASCITIS